MDYENVKHHNNARHYVMKKIQETSPSDRVYIDYKTDERLYSLWKESAKTDKCEYGKYTTPSDIIFAGTIPLEDFEIWCDETGAFDLGLLVKYRAVIFKDYKQNIARFDRLRSYVPEDAAAVVTVGAFIVYLETLPGTKLVVPIQVVRGINALVITQEDSFCIDAKGNIIEHNMSFEDVARAGQALALTWYSIQICLLHPVYKYAIKRSNPTNSKKSLKKQSKRKAKLIRRIYINESDLDRYMEKKGFTRKTLTWYVCGHFRHYHSGHTVFIQPYWKGPLREAKKNLDEGRDREIAVNGNIRIGGNTC